MQTFDEFKAEILTLARAAFKQDDVEFAIGDDSDMRPSFDDGMCAADYVAEQIDALA